MKKLVRNTLTGAVLAANLAGCSLFGESESSFTYPEDQTVVKEVHQQAADFWSKHGVGIAAGAHLVMLNEAETATCGPETITSGSDTFHHCSGDNSIIIPAEALNDMHSSSGLNKAAVQSGIWHEWGHVVQGSGIVAVTKNAPPASATAERTLFDERQATCYAGSLTINIAPQDTAGIRQEFRRTVDSETHGTATQQTASYDQGYAPAALKDPIGVCATVPAA